MFLRSVSFIFYDLYYLLHKSLTLLGTGKLVHWHIRTEIQLPLKSNLCWYIVYWHYLRQESYGPSSVERCGLWNCDFFRCTNEHKCLHTTFTIWMYLPRRHWALQSMIWIWLVGTESQPRTNWKYSGSWYSIGCTPILSFPIVGCDKVRRRMMTWN